ncbi:MAG: heavy-metal-associated domain-containing protein [Ruminococcaceae bacterium]|nr:heavy-metal-associated domain-containing protein [Oscillospiraceae bacterium]
MKKTYKLENLECAVCGQMIEDAIRKLDGVQEVHVSFISQRLTLVAEDAAFEGVLQAAQKICRKTEPDCRIVL